MAHLRFTAAVMMSVAGAPLAACETHGYSGASGNWYEHRQDEVGCAGAARRSGHFPGDAYDSYVSNCVYDRQLERWRDWPR
jgi:hypothetical protein